MGDRLKRGVSARQLTPIRGKLANAMGLVGELMKEHEFRHQYDTLAFLHVLYTMKTHLFFLFHHIYWYITMCEKNILNWFYSWIDQYSNFQLHLNYQHKLYEDHSFSINNLFLWFSFFTKIMFFAGTQQYTSLLEKYCNFFISVL